ncbi:MAG: aminomethyl-transferring glycine dehydrogenase subunit GcvPA [Candidatus Thermoplasmatota archaeon]|nr:aminomethyl-transferring glycine dehydrogenase subunit GcvPA [Candidatus Thermoplasmatota archaeon]
MFSPWSGKVFWPSGNTYFNLFTARRDRCLSAFRRSRPPSLDAHGKTLFKRHGLHRSFPSEQGDILHYLPNHSNEKEMLKKMGLDSIDDLFSDIPEAMRAKKLDLPPGASELEVTREAEGLMRISKGGGDMPMFLGGGFYDHFIPTIVDNVLSRSELYTSYTPYQPEMSQGILQALFEYQSLIADLLHMDAVNTSMYDLPTAIGEAILMSNRINHRPLFLIPEYITKDKLCVIENYIRGSGIRVEKVPFLENRGIMDLDALKGMINDQVSGVYIETPNLAGMFDPGVLRIRDILDPRMVYVVGVNPMSMSIQKAPGDYGADIVVGEAQPIGIPMSYGGPSTGIFATSMKHVRKMPGRIIGASKDTEGRRAFCMTLSTREQHIRRERATSNICTNEALTSISAAVYLSTLGKTGFRQLGIQLASRARYLAERIDALEGFTAPAFDGYFFNEFPVRVDTDVCGLLEAVEEKGVLAGINLTEEVGSLKGIFTVATTEMHTHHEYEKLVQYLKESREVVS